MQMSPTIERLLSEMRERKHSNDLTIQLYSLAQILAHISEQDAHSSERLDIATARLIALTWGLVALTVVLLIISALSLWTAICV